MSDAYAQETELVREDSNYVDRALDTTIALTIVSFLLGLVTAIQVVGLETSGGALTTLHLQLLAVVGGGVGTVGALSWLGVVPITDQRVRGIGIGLVVSLLGLTILSVALPVTMANLLGIVLLLEAGAVLAAGILSWQGLFDTDPSPSAGLLAGIAFGIIGLLIGAAFGGAFLPSIAFSLGLPDGAQVSIDFAHLLPALLVGLVLAAITIAPPEDLGTAIPTAVLVGGLGLVILTGAIGPGWTWSPGEDIDGAFTGQIVIPLFVLTGSIVSSWGAAKARAGYGAVGRQFGSYLVIYLNAAMMVAIMISIVAFVLMKGLNYAFHGFTIGALSALVLLAPLLAVVVDWARTPAGTPDWHAGARQAVRAIPVVLLGGLAGWLAFLQVTGGRFAAPFEYTVKLPNENTTKVLDTAASITTEPTVGTLVVVFSGLLLTWYFLRKYGSLRSVGTQTERLAAVERWVGITVGLTLLLSAILLALPPVLELGVLSLWLNVDTFAQPIVSVLVPVGAVAAVGLAALAIQTLAVGSGRMAERAVEGAHRIRVGLLGGVGLLAAVTIAQPSVGINPRVGPWDIVPAVALVGAGVALAVAITTAALARSEAGRLERVLRKQSALGLAATSAYVVVAALHVAVTWVDFTVAGVTVGVTGTLSWPMTMSAYIPLVPEPGGILPAVVGTTWLVVGAALFAVPLGVGAAVFLTEYAEQGKFTGLVEVATNSLWSTPSVVFGLFGAAFLIPRLGEQESLLTGMLVLGFMLLPLVLITSREAIKSVPDEYRDASAALGVSKWETVKSVVLPAAVPGVITGVILGVGRIAGETAPLILVLGSTLNETSAVDVLGAFKFVGHPPFVANDMLLSSSPAVPTQIWAIISAGVAGSTSMGWGSALVLLLIVLTFYAVGIVTRTYFRKKLNYE